MTNPPNHIQRRAILLILVALVFIWACLDDTPAEPPTSGTHDASSALQGDLGEDPHMMTLAREISGFAGFFYEPGSDRIVVAMTETNDADGDFSTTQQAVLAILSQGAHLLTAANIPPVEFVKRMVKYSFIELAQHRARLRSRLFRIPGDVALEVDEEYNRVKIGVANSSAISAVQDLAVALAVPIDMLAFWQTSAVEESYMPAAIPPFPHSGTLRGRVPDDSLQGGYQIQGHDDKLCTLGFTALSAPGPQEVFVSNSHCSGTSFSKDGAEWHQPASRNNRVGWEIVDPSPHGCWVFGLLVPNIPWPRCRHSDAALMAIDTAAVDIT